MKNFLIISTIVGVVGLAFLFRYLYFSPKPSSSFSAIHGTSLLATPEEIANIIDKNKTQIAQFFFDKGIRRDDNPDNTEYGKYTDLGEIYFYKDKPLTMVYFFRDSVQFGAFFNEVRRTVIETTNYSDSNGNYPAYRIKNCVFVEIGFLMNPDSYRAEIFSADRSKVIGKEKLIGMNDSLVAPQKDLINQLQRSFPAIAYIAVNNAKLFKKINNSFDLEDGSLSKGTKLEVINEEGGYLYCDYEDDNGDPKTAWISNDDITFKKPVKRKSNTIDLSEIKPVKRKSNTIDLNEIEPVNPKQQKYE